MSERRRRRSDDESGGGLPLFPLVLVVILAGLLLGGALAHFFGGSKGAPSATPIPLAALPSPVQRLAPIPTARTTVTPEADEIRNPYAQVLRAGKCDAECAAGYRDARKRDDVEPASEVDAKPDAARSNRSDRRPADRNAGSESNAIAHLGAEQAACRAPGIGGAGGPCGRRPRRVARPLVSRRARERR